jgi:hypothetical protein
MVKRRFFILISLLVVLSLSGCIKINMATKIKKDSSGEKSFVLALDKSVMSMFESMAAESGSSTDDLWTAVRAGADSLNGAKVEEYSDDDSEGIKVIVPFKNLEELAALSTSDAFEGTDTVTVSEEGDTNTLKAIVNMGDLTSGLGEAGGGELEGVDLGEIEIEYTYAVEVEGEILTHSPKNIAKVEGSKVTWDLSQASAQKIELMVRWKPGGGSDMRVMMLIAIVAGGLLLVGIGVMLTMRGRARSDQLPVS